MTPPKLFTQQNMEKQLTQRYLTPNDYNKMKRRKRTTV